MKTKVIKNNENEKISAAQSVKGLSSPNTINREIVPNQIVQQSENDVVA